MHVKGEAVPLIANWQQMIQLFVWLVDGLQMPALTEDQFSSSLRSRKGARMVAG